MKKVLIILMFISVNLISFSQTLHVKGRYLYSSLNEEIVLRGINEMAIWYKNDPTLSSILPEIAKTGSNCARLCWLTSGSPALLDSLISNCLKSKMIPIVELHDATGDWSKLQSLLDYWKKPEVFKIMEKHKKWVLLNIGNEIGPKTSNEEFLRYYSDAVKQLREAGYKVPLIIDASDWGKDEGNITSNWDALMNSDPERNLLFSVHLYWKDDTAEELKNGLIIFLILWLKRTFLYFSEKGHS
ncbi:MAG: glycoside hydrolase family 5 protein [Bacteroidales bacterium]|nr:glycoside hydrolase family 5 protein [Bacteroidales bacterium]